MLERPERGGQAMLKEHATEKRCETQRRDEVFPQGKIVKQVVRCIWCLTISLVKLYQLTKSTKYVDLV